METTEKTYTIEYTDLTGAKWSNPWQRGTREEMREKVRAYRTGYGVYRRMFEMSRRACLSNVQVVEVK